MTSEEFDQKIAAATSREKAYGLAVGYLKDRPRFDWTGVYVLEGQELVLRAFVGKPTEHTRIPVGRGVCGTAIAEKADQRIDDVTKVPNYLMCSLDTRSELVVLIRDGETIYGQIDVDSHTRAAFTDEDHAEVRRVADRIARLFRERPSLPDRPPRKVEPGVDESASKAGRDFYARCSVCKGEIAWSAAWYKCTVSTCNRTRMALSFCSTDCWDSHLPEARHRDPGFTEHKAPNPPTRLV